MNLTKISVEEACRPQVCGKFRDHIACFQQHLAVVQLSNCCVIKECKINKYAFLLTYNMFFCNFPKERLFLMTCFISTKIRGKTGLMYLSTIIARETTSSGITEANSGPSCPYINAFFFLLKQSISESLEAENRGI